MPIRPLHKRQHTVEHTKEHTEEHTGNDLHFNAEDRMWNRLWNLLDDPGDDDWAYVYSVDRFEKPIKPYIAKYWLPGTDLIWQLQSVLGGGLFRVLIRSGRIMKFAGVVGVETPHRRIQYSQHS